jgi:hypothetical protein
MLFFQALMDSSTRTGTFPVLQLVGLVDICKHIQMLADVYGIAN